MADDMSELHQVIGELRAATRMTDDRLNRFEASVWQVVTRTEAKLDEMRQSIASLRESLSSSAGGGKMARWIFGATVAVISIVGTIAGMLSFHFAVSIH